MGCVYGCFLHCMKRCGCCICDCCYGSSKKGFYSFHSTANGQTVFNSPFALILYDKWCKQLDIYQNREQVFEALKNAVIPNKNDNKDRIILDAGCGTGAFTENLCKTFNLSSGGTLICMDTSPQALHFTRTRVVEKFDINLKNCHVEYFNNCANALCLESNYIDDDIDIIFMSFVMNHIAIKNGDRHCILKELYKLCKPGGAYIVAEYGIQFMKQFDLDTDTDTDRDDMKDNINQELLKNTQNMSDQQGFKSCDALQQYVEGFGFVFDRRIMARTFGDYYWILLFRKPES